MKKARINFLVIGLFMLVVPFSALGAISYSRTPSGSGLYSSIQYNISDNGQPFGVDICASVSGTVSWQLALFPYSLAGNTNEQDWIDNAITSGSYNNVAGSWSITMDNFSDTTEILGTGHICFDGSSYHVWGAYDFSDYFQATSTYSVVYTVKKDSAYSTYIGLSTNTMSATVIGISSLISNFYMIMIIIVFGLGIFFWVKRMAGKSMRGSTHI